MNIQDETITKQIQEAIKYSPKSKSAIAKEIGVSCPTLSQYLSGRIQPSLTTFKKLCESLDCSADDLLGIG